MFECSEQFTLMTTTKLRLRLTHATCLPRPRKNSAMQSAASDAFEAESERMSAELESVKSKSEVYDSRLSTFVRDVTVALVASIDADGSTTCPVAGEVVVSVQGDGEPTDAVLRDAVERVRAVVAIATSRSSTATPSVDTPSGRVGDGEGNASAPAAVVGGGESAGDVAGIEDRLSTVASTLVAEIQSLGVTRALSASSHHEGSGAPSGSDADGVRARLEGLKKMCEDETHSEGEEDAWAWRSFNRVVAAVVTVAVEALESGGGASAGGAVGAPRREKHVHALALLFTAVLFVYHLLACLLPPPLAAHSRTCACSHSSPTLHSRYVSSRRRRGECHRACSRASRRGWRCRISGWHSRHPPR
jgi:hypothetical protein